MLVEKVGHRQGTKKDAYRIGEQQPGSECGYIGISRVLETIRKNGYNDRLRQMEKSAIYRMGVAVINILT